MGLKIKRLGEFAVRQMSLWDFEEYLKETKTGRTHGHIGFAVARCYLYAKNEKPVYESSEAAMKELGIDEALDIFVAIKKVSGLMSEDEAPADPNASAANPSELTST